MAKPKFNPNEEFEVVKEIKGPKPKFNPEESFEPVEEKEPTSKFESGLRGAVQGLTMDFGDEITGGLGSLSAIFSDESFGDAYRRNRDESRENYKNAKESNPYTYGTGQVVGGIGSLAIPGLGLAKGTKVANLGMKGLMKLGAKQGLKSGAAYGLGSSEADLTSGKWDEAGQAGLDTIIGGGLGMAMGAGTPLATKGGGVLLRGLDNKTGNVISKGTKAGFGKLNNFLKDAAPQLRPDADEVIKAAESIGTKPTSSMLYPNSPWIQKTESALEQSPGVLAYGARKTRTALEQKIQDAAEMEAAKAGTLSKSDAGQAAKERIYEKTNERFAPIKALFRDIEKSTKHIPVGKDSMGRVVKNINKNETVKMGLGEAKQAVQAFESRSLEDVSVDQLRRLTGSIKGKARETVNGAEKQALGDLINRLERLQNNAIKRSAVSQARTGKEGYGIGTKLINDLKNANSGYKKEITDLGEFGKLGGIKKFQGQQQFKDNLGDLVSERLPEKLYPLGNRAVRNKTSELFPEAADILKRRQISNLVEKNTSQGNFNPRGFIKSTERFDDDLINDLFGAGNKLKDTRTVIGSIPQKVGPSGTPEGAAYMRGGAFNLKQAGYDALNITAKKFAENMGNISTGLNNLVTKTPEVLGKYAPALQQAAARGGTSLAATNYVLQQTDPEYRMQTKDYFGDK